MAILTASVGETSATINYVLSNSYTGDSVSYSWTFSNKDAQVITTSEASGGSFSLNGLPRGSSYTIYATVTITIVTNSTDDKKSSKPPDKHYESADLTIYTHPGPWSWEARKGDIIQETMTPEKLTKWKSWFQKAYHWKTQKPNDYNLSACDMPTDKVITAKWYNACAMALNTAFDKSISYVNGPSVNSYTPTLITDDVINALDFSGLI